MVFSVLICTYNRHELLRLALRALVDGTSEKPDQVVVVNGGDALTDAVVAEFQGRPGVAVELVKTVNRNLAASRNVGLPRCTGEIVAMTDDDAEVFPDWVTQIRRAHAEHPETGAVGGPVLGTNTHTLVGKIADLITFPVWQAPQYVRTLPGVNIAYKRAAVEQIGPQDAVLFRGEDVDYNWRMQRLGMKVLFDPAIKVHHHHRPTLRGLFNQHYMYGRAYYLVRRKWPDMYCIYPRQLRRPKDLLKAINLVASSFYQPLLDARRLPAWPDRIAAAPLLFAAGVAWRGGMAVQRFRYAAQRASVTNAE
jgi:GT2 family glycosyltransferase